MDFNLYKVGEEDFVEIDRINNYLFLVNKDDMKDFCIRKISDNSDAIEPLSGDEEFNNALKLFAEKHKDLIENI